MKRILTLILLNATLMTSVLHAQIGPGLGNLTYNSSELYNSIWTYTEVNHMGSTMATMHNGYLITTFHPDSGVPPGGILVWDVSDPRNPVLVKRIYDSRTSSFRENHALPQHDDYMLFQDGCGFQIWDFSNPLDPQQVVRHCMDGYGHDDYGSTWQMFWQAPYIYIANGSGGFDVVDATDIRNPQLVRHVTTPRQVGPIFAVGNMLVTSAHDFGRGITLYDISDPRNPQMINSYSNTENMYASSLNGNKVVISARGNANNAVFSTYDISDPINIRREGTLDIGNSGEQLYSATQDNFIFQGCQDEVVKIDASDPTALSIVGRGSIATGDVDHGQVSPMGNLVFVGNDHGSGSGFWVHQTEPDTKAPEVNMIYPKGNSVNQALTTRIGMTLTDNLTLESINQDNFIVRPLGGQALAGKYSYQFATINFSPDQPLEPNTTYEIVLPAGGIKDAVGNGIENTFTAYFSTGPSGAFPPATIGNPWVREADGAVTLNWNPVSNTDEYLVRRSKTENGTYDEIGTTNGLSFTDSDVENNQDYFYTISGVNNYGEGMSSPIIKAMPALYITDLNWESSENAWGPVEVDQSNGEEFEDDGNIISLNGETYSRGLGVHAQSSITYNLNGEYALFQSDIGLDDEVGDNGSVIFSILVDGQEAFNSGLLTGGSEIQSVEVDVSGANSLTLNVSPDGDNGLDHVSWGGARLRLPQQPFNSIPHPIPGRIEAEAYDIGGEGLAYHEVNANGNEGNATIRNDEVDIEETGDTDGAYNIGYSLTGEWLEYTVDVQNTADYSLEVRVARDGDDGVFHIEMDGEDITGAIDVPNTGGWQTYETVQIEGVRLTEGEHVMRIAFDSDYTNLNYVEFKGVITGNTNAAYINNGFAVYPNPFAEALTVVVQQAGSITVMDAKGVKLKSLDVVAGENTIQLNQEKGLYLLIYNQGNKQKLIKVMKK